MPLVVCVCVLCVLDLTGILQPLPHLLPHSLCLSESEINSTLYGQLVARLPSYRVSSSRRLPLGFLGNLTRCLNNNARRQRRRPRRPRPGRQESGRERKKRLAMELKSRSALQKASLDGYYALKFPGTRGKAARRMFAIDEGN